MPTNRILRRSATDWVYKVRPLDGGAPASVDWTRSLPAGYMCAECSCLLNPDTVTDVYLAKVREESINDVWPMRVLELAHVVIADLFERELRSARFGRVFRKVSRKDPYEYDPFDPANFRLVESQRCFQYGEPDIVRFYGVGEVTLFNQPENCSTCGRIRGVLSESEAFVLEEDWAGRKVGYGNNYAPFLSEATYRSIDWSRLPPVNVHVIPVVARWDVPEEIQLRLWGDVTPPPSDADARRRAAQARRARRDSQLVRVIPSDPDDDLKLLKCRPTAEWNAAFGASSLCGVCKRADRPPTGMKTIDLTSVKTIPFEPYIGVTGTKLMLVHEALADAARQLDPTLRLVPVQAGKKPAPTAYRAIAGAATVQVRSDTGLPKPCKKCGRSSSAQLAGRVFVSAEGLDDRRVFLDGDGYLCFRVEEWDRVYDSLAEDLRHQIETQFIDIEPTKTEKPAAGTKTKNRDHRPDRG